MAEEREPFYISGYETPLYQTKLIDKELLKSFFDKYLNPVDIAHGGTNSQTAAEALEELFTGSIEISTPSATITIDVPSDQMAPKIIIYGKSTQEETPTPISIVTIKDRTTSNSITVIVNSESKNFNLGPDSIKPYLRGLKTTGDTYTYQDSNGVKWICDTYELNLSTQEARYTQRIGWGYIDGKITYGKFFENELRVTKQAGMESLFGSEVIINEDVTCLCSSFPVVYGELADTVDGYMYMSTDLSEAPEFQGFSCKYEAMLSRETYTSYFNQYPMTVLAPYKTYQTYTFTEEETIDLVKGSNTISISNTDFQLQYLKYVLPILYGGTGATTAKNARDNLGITSEINQINTKVEDLANTKCAKVLANDISLTESSWEELTEDDGTTNYSNGYIYRAAVVVTGITSSHCPQVIFDTTDSVSGQFAPTSMSYNGGVYIYSTAAVAVTIRTVMGIL